jgi:hypothetical protein
MKNMKKSAMTNHLVTKVLTFALILSFLASMSFSALAAESSLHNEIPQLSTASWDSVDINQTGSVVRPLPRIVIKPESPKVGDQLYIDVYNWHQSGNFEIYVQGGGNWVLHRFGANGLNLSLGDNLNVPVGYTVQAKDIGNGFSAMIPVAGQHIWAENWTHAVPSPPMSLSQSTWNAGINGGGINVNIFNIPAGAGTPQIHSSDPSWLVDHGMINHNTMTIVVTSNTGTASRSGIITVSAGGQTASLTVTQPGR